MQEPRNSRSRLVLTTLLFLLTVAALARDVRADPNCKPNRATCKTDGQCCSRSCEAGLCAAMPTTSSTTSTSTSSTTTTTAPSACGDGVIDVEAGEVCDDGDTDENACPYGAPLCTVCSADCTQEIVKTGRYCGDSTLDSDDGEECDDGDTCTETECQYGTGSCTGCSATCTETALMGPFCGDGTTTCPEVCDDNNTVECGSCDPTCTVSTLAAATGLILAVGGSSLDDGETFTIDDGLGASITFEFDTASDGVGADTTSIVASGSDSAALVAASIEAAISASTLQIDAESTSNMVSLVHQLQSAFGNQPIIRTVADPDFFVSGMAGGGGGDCAEDVGCSSDDDCAPELVCDGTDKVCLAPAPL